LHSEGEMLGAHPIQKAGVPMKRWSDGVPVRKLRRPTEQSVVWYCKTCEKSTIAQVPHNVSEALRCPECGTLKDSRD